MQKNITNSAHMTLPTASYVMPIHNVSQKVPSECFRITHHYFFSFLQSPLLPVHTITHFSTTTVMNNLLFKYVRVPPCCPEYFALCLHVHVFVVRISWKSIVVTRFSVSYTYSYILNTVAEDVVYRSIYIHPTTWKCNMWTSPRTPHTAHNFRTGTHARSPMRVAKLWPQR